MPFPPTVYNFLHLHLHPATTLPLFFTLTFICQIHTCSFQPTLFILQHQNPISPLPSPSYDIDIDIPRLPNMPPSSTSPHPRPLTAGPDAGPEPPFPLRVSGKVVKGFGRGSKELGIPTANIPIAGLSVGGHEDVENGVYYGWAGLDIEDEEEETKPSEKGKQDGQEKEEKKRKGKVYPMVMSIGWNPFYKNTVRSVEVHLLHTFTADFYSSPMNLLILGFIRPEYNYVSREALIEDINTDIQVARRSLEREAYRGLRAEGFLREFKFGKEGEVGVRDGGV